MLPFIVVTASRPNTVVSSNSEQYLRYAQLIAFFGFIFQTVVALSYPIFAFIYLYNNGQGTTIYKDMA